MHGSEICNQYGIQRAIAMSEVARALKDGRLTKPAECELCDESESALMGHHWKGYDGPNALNVLWACRGCNVILRGRKYHSGSVSKEESRAIIQASKKARQDKANQTPIQPIKLKDYEVTIEVGRYRYEVLVPAVQTQKIAIDAAKSFIIAETGTKEVRVLVAGRYYKP